MPFLVFSRHRFPECLQNVSISSHWELPADAVSPPGNIFSNPVFARPYGDLNTILNVGKSKKRKKTCTNTLETFVAAHCEEIAFESTPGSKNHKKRTPVQVQMDTLATNSAPSVSPCCTLVHHIGTKISKNSLQVSQLSEKYVKCTP